MISNPAHRFAIVPLPPGTSNAPGDAIVVGPMSEVTEYIVSIHCTSRRSRKSSTVPALASDQIASMQSKTRGVQAAMLADTIKQLDARLNTLTQRRADAASARQRRDEEEEQRRIQAQPRRTPRPRRR